MTPQSISISAAARQKDCSRQTVYSNFDKFDVSLDFRVIPNKKFLDWQPKRWGGRIHREKLAVLKGVKS